MKPTPGSTKQKLRKGRGESGKRGKTAGRGTKGTGARKTVPAYFEGGQIPLYRRIPKVRGIGNAAKMSYVVVNVSELEEKNLEGEVTPDILREMGLTRKKGLVKILGDGEITKKIDLVFHLAAINGTANFYKIPDKVININTQININIFEYIKNKKTKIIFSSSSEVYSSTTSLLKNRIPSDEKIERLGPKPTDITLEA